MFLAISLAIFLVAWALTRSGPLHSAIEIGGDEHFELTKSLLWSKGIPLYTKIWSDQPPLYTVLLGTLFKWFGPAVGVARALAICFGLLLLAGCFTMVKQRHGLLGACIATVCLLMAPYVTELSVSAMKEVPAIGIALWALWPLLRWRQSRNRLLLAVSGVFLAAGLQIKFAAGLLIPALAVEIILASQGADWRAHVKDAAANLVIWAGSAISAFFFATIVLGGNYNQIWGTHVSSGVAQGVLSNDYSFSTRIMLQHADALWGAGAGLLILIAVFRRDWQRIAFPIVLLLTVFLFHVNHSPWWYFYYVHLALPLAWLTGAGIAELFRIAWAGRTDRSPRSIALCAGSWLAASVLLALQVVDCWPRFVSGIDTIRGLPRVEDSALIKTMEQYAPQTKLVYAQDPVFAFHAKLSVIPELAVVSKKRYWSGQLSQDQQWAAVRKSRPEQLLLAREVAADVQEFIDSNYRLVYEEGEYRLYLAKTLQ